MIFSGRTPTFTAGPARRARSESATSRSPPVVWIVVRPFDGPVISPASRFDAPRNPATNIVCGLSYTSSGPPICSIAPLRITARRSDIVIASS